MTKKIFAMFLAVLMVVSMLPTSVFAATCPLKGTNNHTKGNCEYTVVAVIEPTCGSIGYTLNKCNACGDQFRTDEVKATGEHTLVSMDAKAPTCGGYGFEAGQKCSGCNAEFPGAPIKPVVAEGYSCEWSDWAPANVDCTTGGVKTRYCLHCGTQDKPIEIEVGAHTWDEKNPVLVKAATATENGLATVECTTCKITKDVVVFFEHNHVWLTHDEVPATCTTNGVAEHMECRVCGVLLMWDAEEEDYVVVSEEDLVITAFHVYAHPSYGCECEEGTSHVPTCVDHVLTCTVCRQTLAVDVEHNFEEWTTPADAVPTCLKSGYEESICSTCGIAKDTNPLAALGHRDVTVSVPATCGTYAYTFTYCTREDCDGQIAVDFEVLELLAERYPMNVAYFDLVTAAAVNPYGFYLAATQSVTGTDIFFTGELVDGVLATSNDVSKAVKVYLEIVHPLMENAYRLFFYNDEGVKTYITIEGSMKADGTKVGTVKLTTEVPTTYFAWNDEYDVLTTTVACYTGVNGTFFLGTTEKNETFSAFEAEELGAEGQMYAQLGSTSAFKAADLVSYSFDFNGKFNANNHEKMVDYTLPTCTEPGVEHVTCAYCDFYAESEIPAEHTWTAYEEGVKITVNGKEIDAVVDAVCEDGYYYVYCSECDVDPVKVDVKGYGHLWGELIEVEPDHMNTTVYDYHLCDCGERKNVTRKTWTDANKHWNSEAEAEEEGKHTLSETYTQVKKGSCTEYGLNKYTCEECKKAVYVKIAGTGAHVEPELGENLVVTTKKSFVSEVTGCYVIVTENVPAGLKLNEVAVPAVIQLVKGEKYNFTGEGELEELVLAQVSYTKAPSCTEAGWHITYVCARCEQIVGQKAVGMMQELKKLAHSYVDVEGYEASDCFAPVFDNKIQECEDCGDPIFDTKKLGESTLVGCEGKTYLYYLCHCGEEHIVGYNTFEHNYVRLPDVAVGDKRADGSIVQKNDTDVTYKAPTCYEKGFYTVKCEFCGDEQTEEIGKTNHVNAADEEFNVTCLTSSVTDRHCVVCHARGDHDTKGNAHKCGTAIKVNGVVVGYECEGECWFSANHAYTTVAKPSTCLEDGHYVTMCAYCKDESVEFFNGGWNGHMPAAAKHVKTDCTATECKDPAHYERFGNYQYAWFKHVSVVVNAEGKLESFVKEYMAEFVLGENGEAGYVAPSYTAAGYANAYCQKCGGVHEWTLAKLEGLEFDLSVNTEEAVLGSEIVVTITANGFEELVYGFDFELTYDGTKLHYVRAETVTEKLMMSARTPKGVLANLEDDGYTIPVAGQVAFDAAGNMQNMVISEEIELIKLYFRVIEEGKAETLFSVKESNAKAYDANALDVNNPFVGVFCSGDEEKVAIRELGNFNKDDMFHSTDLYLAMALLTGELADGKNYDVTVDFDKDGIITVEDLLLGYDYYLGNISDDEMFFMGVNEADAQIIEALYMSNGYSHHCINEECEYGSNHPFVVCPECFTAQNVQ